ncbi:MAG: hypothetical protein WC346_21640 [Methanogenium sp.]|jgi:hypothetical protein
MKTIELTIPHRLYLWLLVTWTAIIFGITVTTTNKIIKQYIPNNDPIVRQANGTLEPEILGLRRDNIKLKEIVKKLDINKMYINDITD